MGACVRSYFGKPRTWHHDASGVNHALFHRSNRGRVFRMRDPDVVRMDDQKFRIPRISQSLLYGFLLSVDTSRKKEQNENCDPGLFHNAMVVEPNISLILIVGQFLLFPFFRLSANAVLILGTNCHQVYSFLPLNYEFWPHPPSSCR